MASIKVIKAGWEVELEIPDDEEVMHSLRYETMITTAADTFQTVAKDPTLGTDERVDKLDAIGDLQIAILEARDAALPTVQISVEA